MTSNAAPKLASSEEPNELASRQQHLAASPALSAWVEASAGSGKTKVLIDRVLRLLLAGVKAHHILCLTFTKAAAAEMAVRLTRELGRWATLPPAELAKVLSKLTKRAPADEEIDQARRLFAATLDAPGGLQLMTIHSFCQSLLARFPLEAGVPVGFGVIEGRASEELLQLARREALADASAHPQGELARAINTLLEDFGGEEFAKLEQSIIASSSVLEAQLQLGPLPQLSRLDELLEITEGETSESIAQRFCSDEWQDVASLRDMAQEMIAEGGKTNSANGTLIADWLARDVPGRVITLDKFLSVFRKKDGDAAALKSICTDKLREAHPAFDAIIAHEQELIDQHTAKKKALATRRASRAIIIYAADILQRYRRHKTTLGALDFEDLINAAARLVTRESAPWVLYKLDGGIEHVLVDEAQDTNARQWQLAQALTTDFFSGEGQQNNRPHNLPQRSVFAVGDYKQSIYSFQGADPRAFRLARDTFAQRIAATGQELQVINFKVSFRSTAAVLSAVDRVFFETAAKSGLPGYLEHISAQPQLPGQVELWPIAQPDDKEAPNRASPPVKLAHVLALQIRQWVESKELLTSRGRPMDYGDFMVLVRSRAPFMPEFVRACKKLHVPIAGADRLLLDNQLAVQDMLAFAAFLLLPEDDLTLATVLKGPFIGMSEEALFEIAHNRKKGESLLSRLGKAEKATAEWLAGWQKKTDRITPYTLLSALLAEPCPQDARSGRRAILARLGPEASDPLDELLSLALDYEQGEVPSLQGFLRWFSEGETEIKRQMDQTSGQVRIMTTHGSKGLQAPIVIVADGVTPKPDKKRLLLDPEGAEPPLLAAKRADEAPAAQKRREILASAEREESHRLLYVALTRAEDRLIFAAWSRNDSLFNDEGELVDSKGVLKADPEKPAWYHYLRQSLSSSEEVLFDFSPLTPMGWRGKGWRLSSGSAQQSRTPEPKASISQITATLPGWATRLPPAEPSPTRPLTPSRLEEDDVALSPLADNDGWRFRRGLLIHRLLQTLPDLPPEKRRRAGLAWLSRQAKKPEQLIDEVLAVINHPDHAVLFAPGSQAEVPISGQVGPRTLAGQIDRLSITADTVWLADYKTNRQRPASLEAVDKSYIRQLAAYRAVLRPLYPDKRIRAILLWTDGPTLMEVPDTLLDLALP